MCNLKNVRGETARPRFLFNSGSGERGGGLSGDGECTMRGYGGTEGDRKDRIMGKVGLEGEDRIIPGIHPFHCKKGKCNDNTMTYVRRFILYIVNDRVRNRHPIKCIEVEVNDETTDYNNLKSTKLIRFRPTTFVYKVPFPE